MLSRLVMQSGGKELIPYLQPFRKILYFIRLGLFEA